VPPKSNAFLEAIIAYLLPYFALHAKDPQDARSEVIDTLASYATRTAPEMLQAARIIAFGFAALDTLAEAKTTELSPALRIRCCSCANSLNRSTATTEKALGQSLAKNPSPAPQPDKRARTAIGSLHPHPDQNTTIWAGAMIDALARMGYAQQKVQAGQ
jgi:hypothetical protein